MKFPHIISNDQLWGDSKLFYLITFRHVLQQNTNLAQDVNPGVVTLQYRQERKAGNPTFL